MPESSFSVISVPLCFRPSAGQPGEPRAEPAGPRAPGDRDEAAELLRQAHAAAEHMGIPQAGQIRSIQQQEGLEVLATDALRWTQMTGATRDSTLS